MDREATAIRHLRAFAERTGLIGAAPPRRYLWTDAFAVCTWLELYRRRRDPELLELAAALVEQVHQVLGRLAHGRHRGAPLGGADEADRARHPTRHGLRIGKPLPERAPDEPFDERREWDRDGQYFHYLTRWMHALERYARVSGSGEAHRWAAELCQAGLAFIDRDASGRPRAMVWKRSVDLDRVLVPSMGQHDPLDGWITAAELAASPLAERDERARLRGIVRDFRSLDSPRAWPSADPLGIGGLLNAAARRWFDGAGDPPAARESGDLFDAAAQGLQALLAHRPFDAPASQRLAFRELGLVIGLESASRLQGALESATPGPAAPVRPALERLQRTAAALPDLRAFWCAPAHREVPSWTEHLDINAVMLAASLVPEDPSNEPFSQ